MTPQETLLYFVVEREAIRKRKASGIARPYTQDPILRTYRFCNIRRRDDRVSQWLIKHILAHSRQPSAHFLSIVALCRFINWPPTIQALLELHLLKAPLDWHAIGVALDVRRRHGEKTWSSAYMIKGKPMGKGKYIASQFQQAFQKENLVLPAVTAALDIGTCEAVHNAFQLIPECGRFIAGQIVADLTYTPLLAKATDLYTWAPLGPGSRRGYNRMMGITPIKKWPNIQDFLARLVDWRTMIILKLGSEYNDLTLMDCQNVLCEYDKYMRAKLGEGRPKSYYVPETRF